LSSTLYNNSNFEGCVKLEAKKEDKAARNGDTMGAAIHGAKKNFCKYVAEKSKN
jgi:hypothetical protein